MGNQLLQLLNTNTCPRDSFHAAINTKTTYRASSHMPIYSGSTATPRRPSTFQNLLRCASILKLTCSDMPRHCSLRFSATTKMNALEQRKVCAYLDFNTEQLLKGCTKGGCAGGHLLHLRRQFTVPSGRDPEPELQSRIAGCGIADTFLEAASTQCRSRLPSHLVNC